MQTRKLLPIFLCLLIFSCQPKQEKSVLFTLQVDEPDLEQEYSLMISSSTAKQLYGEPEYTFTLGEDGTYQTTLNIEQPVMALVRGDFYKSIYLEPGKPLMLKANKQEDKKVDFEYEGEGAEYLKVLDSLSGFDRQFAEKHSELKYRQYSLDWDEFKKQSDELSEAKNSYIQSKSDLLSEDFKYIMKAQFFAENASGLRTYGSYYNAYQKKEGEEDFEAPGLSDVYQQAFQFDDRALTSSRFGSFVTSYVNTEGVKSLGDFGDTPWYSTPGVYQKLYDFTVDSKEIPENYKSYMLGDFVSMLIMSVGIDEAWDFKDEYLADYPDSKYAKIIETSYAKFEPIRSGKVAPDFEYESIDGEMVSLSSLKGNVVYVDVWATWCGPCISEFPSYKELKKRLAHAEDVKWLYVSVDDADDKEKWVKFLEKNELDGIQLFGGNGWDTSITEKYQIKGIPRYLLIDKEGKIYSSNAPRPSSGDVIYNEIQKLRGVSLENATSMR